MHDHGTRNARNNLVDIPQVRTQTYGHFSIKSRCANIWNILQNTLRKTCYRSHIAMQGSM